MHRSVGLLAAVVAAASVCLAAPTLAGADTFTFSNTNTITIPAGAPTVTLGPATPYPSPINVAGLGGTVTHVTVTLTGLTHTAIQDVGVLLVGPIGENVELMNFAGFGSSTSTLTFDDAASASLPFFGAIPTGTYTPSVFSQALVYAAPAPARPYGSALSVFNGVDPNGTWSLYVQDFAPEDVGSMSGWSLTITTGKTPEQKISDLQDLVASMNIQHGITNALTSKLQNALDALAINDTATACFWMGSFAGLVNSQTGPQPGKMITSAQSQQLLAAAADIQTQLRC
jgi:subtilisin-like proprotein convertase family protein